MPDPASISAEQMKLVLDASRMLTVTSDLGALLTHIAHAACNLIGCERASIFLHDPATHELWTKVALQSDPIRLPEHSGIAGCAFTENRLLHVADPYADPRFNAEPDRRSGFHTRNLLAAPMLDLSQQPVGVIEALNKTGGDFQPLDRALLQLLADQAGVAIQRYHLQRSAMEGAALRREMSLAREVQQELIPAHPPIAAGIEAAGWTLPASITGGDTFDLWKLPDGRVGVFLGDAAGHGMAAAMVVSQVRTLIRAVSESNPDPAGILQLVNARLASDFPPDRFVTAFVGYLAADGALSWSSAGHGPIFLRAAPGAPLQTLFARTPPLGVDSVIDKVATTTTHLDPGGILIVPSDGIHETTDPDENMFGVPRLVALLESAGNLSPDALIARIRQAVHDWQRSDEALDDQTVVILRRV